MNKREFQRRLERAAVRARATAQHYVLENLPSKLLYILPLIDDARGSRGPKGTIKFFGGRFLRPEELYLVSLKRAADLLWCDGKIPAWVNVMVECLDDNATHILLYCSRDLRPADETKLGRDIPSAVIPEDPVEPFRIRGPAVPHKWHSVEQDGRVSLLDGRGAKRRSDYLG